VADDSEGRSSACVLLVPIEPARPEPPRDCDVELVRRCSTLSADLG